MMTTKEFSAYIREGIYSLRFAAILLILIILLFIIVQICEMLYSFIRLTQQNLENNEYGPTEVIMEDGNKCKRRNSRKTRRRRERTNKEGDIVQSSSFDEDSDHHNGIFDEKSTQITKSSSFSSSLVPSNSFDYSRKQLKENPLRRKYFTTKEQSANKLSIPTNKGSKADESSTVTIDSSSEEDHTQTMTDSIISSSML